MKRFLKFCFLIVAVACVILLSSIPTFAADGMEEYRGFIDSLPDEVSDSLPDGIKSQSSEEIASAVKEMSGVKYLLGELFGSFTSGIEKVLPSMCRVLGLIVIAAVIKVCTALSQKSLSAVLAMLVNKYLAKLLPIYGSTTTALPTLCAVLMQFSKNLCNPEDIFH